MAKRILIIGASCDAMELVQELGYEIVGVVDAHLEGTYFGHPVLGGDDEAEAILERNPGVNGVIAIDDPAIRAKVCQRYEQLAIQFPPIISPHACVSKHARVGTGALIQRNATVCAFAEIGDFSRVNFNAFVAHETSVGRFTTLAPNVCLNGRITIGERCYIGSSASIHPGVRVEDGAIISMGASVFRDVPADATYIGNPAKRIR